MIITRRACLRSALAGGSALLAARGAAWAVEAGPVAETHCGKVRGASVKGVHIFRGIPYGGPTEGAGRFLPPANPAKWTGVRDATVTGSRCLQEPGNIFLSPVIGEYFAGGRPDLWNSRGRPIAKTAWR